jgi:hypothetical protein
MEIPAAPGLKKSAVPPMRSLGDMAVLAHMVAI